jgi:hypothetical protein
MGLFQKAALEFQHASKGPMPPDEPSRRDRLGFMYGFGEALVGLTQFDEAERVFRQCTAFAQRLYGSGSAAAAAANVPLADALLAAGRAADALKIAQGAYDALWALGDPLIAFAIPVRADALKAAGRTDDPFADLHELPDEIVAQTAAAVVARAPAGDPVRVRAVLADLLAFADQKFGDGHPVLCDALAAVAHHEARQGAAADEAARRDAVRRAVWSFTVRRVPSGLLSNLEVGFEPDGGLHLVPHLTREPDAAEAEQLQTVLTQAVDDLYARPEAKA